ncbi:hypothetical protein D9M72_581220 [compost metagenome]
MRSKRRSDQMVENSASSATDGRMVGHTTALNTLRRSAPSITAASRSSEGTPCSAASSTTEANGKICQMVVSSTAGIACCMLSSQFSLPDSMPKKRSVWPNTPYWAL